MAESTSPSACLYLDKSSCERSQLTFTEDGENVENDFAEVRVTKQVIFKVSRATASRMNFAANLARRVFTLLEESFEQCQGGVGEANARSCKNCLHPQGNRSHWKARKLSSQCVGATHTCTGNMFVYDLCTVPV